MAEPPAASAAAPKRRALFKRPAWQDKPQNENADIFRHANEFADMVAEQARRRDEERKQKKQKKQQTEAAKEHKHSEPRHPKRRRISNDAAPPPIAPESPAHSNVQGGQTSSKARSITPLSPPPHSLSARYDPLTKSTSSSHSLPESAPHVIQLDDSDDDNDNDNDNDNRDNGCSSLSYKPRQTSYAQHMAVRPSVSHVLGKHDDQDDELEDTQGSIIAALETKAQAQVQAREQIATITDAAASTPAPIAHLFIEPEMDNAKPLKVKVRIDNTIEKARVAWCGLQAFSPQMTNNVFFTWKGTRLYDSTTIKRLGIQVDEKGNVTVEGDSNIYDEVNLPKIHVQAWTEELFKERKKQDAAAAAAKKAAAKASVVIQDRAPTPELAPTVTKIRLVLRARGRADFKLTVNPDTTFAHIASAYKSKLKIDKDQPITLMFDGDRLMPLDTVFDRELEDMDTVDILFN